MAAGRKSPKWFRQVSRCPRQRRAARPRTWHQVVKGEEESRGESLRFVWVERFSKVAKDDLFLAKNNIIAANAKLAGNEYICGYAI
ncbi:hypothetical protein PHISCL_10801 [Aspergillus sclerotialis]|uniref:Uncharacterized protein n=1 Tax=Aspergillus sclerotialis TaxID=2070753 RepID=A0A3A2Z193_9EURO|nr:hypothetical protein PHISCL_10801 [Aspergillus sclerotialis]